MPSSIVPMIVKNAYIAVSKILSAWFMFFLLCSCYLLDLKLA